jgi:hypothetical protein
MKKHLIIPSFLFLIVSCTKNNHTPNYFNVELNNKVYSFDSTSVYVDTIHFYIYINAVNTQTHSTVYIQAISNSKDNLVTTYPNNQNLQPLPFLQDLGIGIITDIANRQYVGGYYSYYGYPLYLTISQINNNFIQGTFSGRMRANVGDTSLLVNGQFNIPNK